MIRKTRLFTPGPTPLLPAAQFAMAAADIHHRTPEFRALYMRVLEQLRALSHGLRIKVGISEAPPPRGVDTEDDLAAVDALLASR